MPSFPRPSALSAVLSASLFACGLSSGTLAARTAPPELPKAPQSAPPAAPSAPDATATEAPRVVLDRVAVIGASLTAGFFTTVRADVNGSQLALPVSLTHVLEQLPKEPIAPVYSSSSLMFFTDPLRIGRRMATTSQSKDPTLLIAIDFLFWYGYGDLRGAPESTRLTRLEEGLALLDAIPCPIVVGDFPNMSEAVGKLLTPEQMPALETLEALNLRLREWAVKRPRVVLFPLAQMVTILRGNGDITIGSTTWTDTSKRLLQVDRLHPTTEGMIAVTQRLAELLRALDPALPEDAFVMDPEALLKRVAAAAGARASAGSGTK